MMEPFFRAHRWCEQFDRRGLALAGGVFLGQTALDIGTLFAHFDADGFNLPTATASHLDFAMGLTLERNPFGLGRRALDRSVTVALAQVCQ